ncbi:PepSY domain-containing protein [Rhodanobacter denitrificans]|uniref:PepSY domain-containing protein n=1 Tax=Rhodanobacteraceae TaxID=1775411 RepID=UPI000260D095|nr:MULTISPECIES: PepSY domain-containing protein [Rhodanobacteraceae]EIM04314.1 propeptide PepSY amd peptidase M4 [Rhodanobacter denitrificans]MCX7515252.1 PepSY domain-containing protein [Frateuria sp. STR12]UJM89021.1 PepSY domain-containing protein [Rhodanobacter denitrificans]
MRKWILIASSLALSTAALAATPNQGKHAMHAQITKTEARAIALKTFPGTIAKEELEKEKGGSGLRYSFDIVAKGVTHEVGVDAKDGHILENSIDNDKD